MSTQYFRVVEHVVPCQHIRQYPRATANAEEDTLHMSVKQYMPLSNLKPQYGDVTIIAGHANGFPKEVYEPLWDEILHLAEAAGFGIRGIWIADVAQQGQSGVLNEDKLGNDPSWFDHPRDLLHMINVFRDQMPRPIVGIGHSMGGNHLTNLSLLHPRLLETLVLIDPVISRQNSKKNEFFAARASAKRRDRWESRESALNAFRKNKFYQKWEPRLLDLWVKYGLRELPTLLYPNSASQGEVTLTTTKFQEVATFLRLGIVADETSGPSRHETRRTRPDLTPTDDPSIPFYRPEPVITFNNLPYLRPSVLYIFGERSSLSMAQLRAEKLAVTGVGIGGSGGHPEGRVEEVLIHDAGHLIPMEKVVETAEHTVRWLGTELARWKQEDTREKEEWASYFGQKKGVPSPEYLKHMLDPDNLAEKAKL